MTDIAALNIGVDTDKVKQSTTDLQTFSKAASASERAAEKWGMTTKNAARTSEDFSKRVRKNIADLEFERAQLTRSAAEREKHNAIRRAGVSAMSAEGQAIMASVTALQAQRAAVTTTSTAKKAATAATTGLITQLRGLAAVYLSVQAAQQLWTTAMGAGDLGEQAEQIGINTDQLQAYRLAGAQAGIGAEQLDGAIVKLAKAMGTAAEGNKEMIANFEQLGVKLLDANGELRPVADVLPEVARGILGIGSSSQRTATLMEFFGKSGAKMATVLEQMGLGNDALIASARQENAIISPAAIAAWDTLGDKLTTLKQIWGVLVAELGAKYAIPFLDDLSKGLATTKQELDALVGAWGRMTAAMNAAKAAAPVNAAKADESNVQDQLGAARNLLAINPNNKMAAASVAALERQLAERQAAVSAQQSIVQFGQQGALQAGGAPSASVSAFLPQTPLGVTSGGTSGARNPTAKASGGGGSDPYKNAIEGARDYVAAKNAETAAVGMSIQAAARMKHEQDLLNKVTSDGKNATQAQRNEIAALAQKMSEADEAFSKAKFMDDFKTKTEEVIVAQQIERDTLFMSTEAAMAYRLEQEAINRAKSEGISLTAEETQRIREQAAAQAAAVEQTRQVTEIFEFGRETFQGFFSDFTNGLREGQSLWESFGNSAMAVLNKIADKLLSMTIDNLFTSAFGGKSGGGGGGLFGALFGMLGIGGGGGGLPGGPSGMATYANGASFRAGSVTPLARGGVVNHPTLFPMAKGMGLMGEAGPEAVMPLKRGRGGRLGVEAHGGGGNVIVIVNNNAAGTQATTKESKGPGGERQIEVLVDTVDNRIAGRINRGQSATGKAVEVKYGLSTRAR